MEAMEKIYYALGQLCYLVAASDGKVHQSEINKLHEIVVDEIKNHNSKFEYSDIIFNVLKEESLKLDLIYDFAFKELKESSNYLTPEVKKEINSVLNKIAESFNGIEFEEKELLSKIEKELESI